jgi:PAS domain S-box-containing protein
MAMPKNTTSRTDHVPPRAGLSFRTKIVLLCVLTVLLGMAVALWITGEAIRRMETQAARRVTQSLDPFSRNFFDEQVQAIGMHVDSWLDKSHKDLYLMARLAQHAFDQPVLGRAIASALPAETVTLDDLRYYHDGRYSQNSDGPVVVYAPAYLHASHVPPELNGQVGDLLLRSVPLDPILHFIQQRDASYLQTYFIGPPGCSLMRMSPWRDIGGQTTRSVPSFTDTDYWTYCPGVVKYWRGQVDRRADQPIVTTPPCIDFATGSGCCEMVLPIWNRSRTKLAGSVWLDLNIQKLDDYIRDIKVGRSGFAFLMLSDGTVISASRKSLQKLGFQSSSSRSGAVQSKWPRLGDSGKPQVRRLTLPQDDRRTTQPLRLGGREYLLTLSRIEEVHILTSRDTVQPLHWVVGMALPVSELEAPAEAAVTVIRSTAGHERLAHLMVFLALMVGLAGMAWVFGGRLTKQWSQLTMAAERLKAGDYSARVPVRSRDEIGQLSTAFNELGARLEESFEQIRRQHEELQHDRQRYRLLAENSCDVICLSDVDGSLRYISPAVTDLLGYPPAEMIGMKGFDAIHPEDRERVAEQLNQSIEDETRQRVSQYRLRHREGHYIWVEATWEVLFDDETLLPSELLVAIRDISARRETEEALKRTERLAAVGNLAAGVAHEYNNAMCAIVGGLSYLEQDASLSGAGREYLDLVRKATDRVIETTRKMQAFTRRQPTTRQPTPIDQVVDETLPMIDSEVRNNDIELVIHHDQTVWANVNPAELSQVLLSLLINAAHALINEPHRQMTITVSSENDWALLSVADTGCGIRPEDLGEVMHPFFTRKGEFARNDRTRSQLKGTGLGLSVSQHIVHTYDGEITIDSTLGVGTTVTIRLPATLPPEA